MKRREFLSSTLVLAAANLAPRAARATVLASADIHAHNDFENPRAVEPREQPATIAGSTFSWTFAPASVTKLEIELA